MSWIKDHLGITEVLCIHINELFIFRSYKNMEMKQCIVYQTKAWLGGRIYQERKGELILNECYMCFTSKIGRMNLGMEKSNTTCLQHLRVVGAHFLLT